MQQELGNTLAQPGRPLARVQAVEAAAAHRSAGMGLG